jgi:ubiquinone/menaquinone biosynthesis C-methylase UbiE
MNYKKNIFNILQDQKNKVYKNTLTKYSYILGANYFIELTQDKYYQGYFKELKLINNFQQVLNKINTIKHIYEFGPGDGSKIKTLLNNFQDRLSYTAIDISNYFLNITNLKINNNCCNFIKGDFTQIDLLKDIILTKNNLIVIFGNTIANEINIKDYLLKLNKAVCKKNDYLLIGIELINRKSKLCISKVIKEYLSNGNKKLTISPLLLMGIKSNSGRLDISFNINESRIEEAYIFLKKTKIIYNDRLIIYNKGDKLILSITQKPSYIQFKKICEKSGWTITNIFRDENQYLLLLKKYI